MRSSENNFYRVSGDTGPGIEYFYLFWSIHFSKRVYTYLCFTLNCFLYCDSEDGEALFVWGGCFLFIIIAFVFLSLKIQ